MTPRAPRCSGLRYAKGESRRSVRADEGFVGRLLFSVFVGLVATIVVWFGFGLYTWTAIHSGWSHSGIRTFFVASWAAPLIVGALAGWWSYRSWPRPH